jgi:hypothetical protein
MSSKFRTKESAFITAQIDELEARCQADSSSLAIISAVNDIQPIVETEQERWRQVYINAFKLPYDERHAWELEAAKQINALDCLLFSMRMFRSTHLKNVQREADGL